MFYSLVKIWVRLALRIFCTNTTVRGGESLAIAGPVLLVANHPNSFLDAIVIGAQFDRPVHFLARGDAFNKPWHNTLLSMLNMIPVYRLREGKENLHLNERAFQRSKEVLADGGIVLIFIEGICLNTHQLQPFKKGAARIAWENRRLPGFSILPLGIAFDSFSRFGKIVNLHFGKPLFPKILLPYEEEARSLICFNQTLFAEINQRIQVPVAAGLTIVQKFIYAGAAWVGWLVHVPLYYPVKNFVRKKTAGTVFLIRLCLVYCCFCIRYICCCSVFCFAWQEYRFQLYG